MKVARRVLLVLAIVYGVYLVAGNALLVTKRVPTWINGAQDNVEIDYGFALSPLPGLVWVHDFRLVSKDSAVEMELRIDRALTWIAIPALFDNTFAAHGGSATGIELALRGRRPVAELCRDDAHDLPPIHGLAAPRGAWADQRTCLAQAETALPITPTPPIDELWRVELYGIHGEDLRDLWIESFRYRGHADTDVSFKLWPTCRLEVPEIALAVRTASIGRGRAPIAAIVGHGDVALSVREMRFGGDDVATISRSLSATVAMDAEVQGLSLLDRSLAGSGWIGFGESKGHLTIDARIVRGAIAAGTRAELADATVVMRAFEHTATGRGRALVEVKALGTSTAARELTTTVRIDRADVTANADRVVIARARGLRVDARGDDPTLGRPLRDLDLHFKAGTIEVPDLARLNRYVPGDVSLELVSGTAEVAGELDVRRGSRVRTGLFELHTTDLRARYADLQIGARAQLHLPLGEGALGDDTRLAFDGARLGITQAHVVDRVKKEGDTGWRADITVLKGLLRGQGPVRKESPLIEADVQGVFASIRPFLAIYGAEGRLPQVVRDYDPGEAAGRARVRVSPERVWMDEATLTAGTFRAEANLYVEGDDTNGGVLLGLGPLRLGVEIENGESSINVVSPSERFKAGTQKRRAQRQM